MKSILALLAIMLALMGMVVATFAHGQGATEGYNIAQDKLQRQHAQELAALKAAYMENAILRERLSDLQARYLSQWERAEQATAERDWARSRLSWYEPHFRDFPAPDLPTGQVGHAYRQAGALPAPKP